MLCASSPCLWPRAEGNQTTGRRRKQPHIHRRSHGTAGQPQACRFFVESATMTDMRILIVEDDREAASYLLKAFTETGHVADHAADGIDGYAMAKDGPY